MQQPPMSPSLAALLERIEAIMHTQPEEALAICETVFEQSRQLREPLAQVIAAEHYGLIMDHLGLDVKARDVLFEAVQVAQSACLFVNEARLIEQIARGYYTTGEYRQAIQYWAHCVEVSDLAGRDALTWILSKIGLGQLYFAMGDYESGLALLKEAESRIGEVDDPHLDVKIKINVAVGLFEINRGQEAIEVLKVSLAMCQLHHYADYEAESYFRLGQVELAEGSVDKAIEYLDLAIPPARQVSYRWGESFTLALQADAYARRAEYAKALEKIQAAQAISSVNGFEHMLCQQHFAASGFAKALGDTTLALGEFTAGYDCERRMLASTAAERNRELEEKAGLRPSVSRLLVELSNHHLIEEGQLDPAFQLITKEASRLLDIGRVSIWLFDHELGNLVCRCLYSASTGDFSREGTWRQSDFPVYFARLNDANPLIAHDAMRHPHTVELEQGYLAERGIKSMLVFPIMLSGKTSGVLSLEAISAQRNWTPDDVLYGGQLADVSGRVIASYERKQLKQEIDKLNQSMREANELLEARVIERTTALERHTMEMHEVQEKLFVARKEIERLSNALAAASAAKPNISADEPK